MTFLGLKELMIHFLTSSSTQLGDITGLILHDLVRPTLYEFAEQVNITTSYLAGRYQDQLLDRYET